MSNFPHNYISKSSATNDSLIDTVCDSSPSLQVSPPPQFGGPEGHWTPEAFFASSISSCFILTFRAVARAKKLDWQNLEVEVDAQLNKEGAKLYFDEVTINAKLTICCESNVDPFLKTLDQAEKGCLITNSIVSKVKLIPKIKIKATKAS